MVQYPMIDCLCQLVSARFMLEICLLQFPTIKLYIIVDEYALEMLI
jgi:hypothetical protein